MQIQINTPTVPATETPVQVADDGFITEKDLLRAVDVVQAAQEPPFEDNTAIGQLSVQVMTATEDFNRCCHDLTDLQIEFETAIWRDDPPEDIAQLLDEKRVLDEHCQMNGRRVLRMCRIMEGLMHAVMDAEAATAE